jgi:hypothetical protein
LFAADSEQLSGARLILCGALERLHQERMFPLPEGKIVDHRRRGSVRPAPGGRRGVGQEAAQLVQANRPLAAENEKTLDQILELACVAGPSMGAQPRQRLRRDGARGSSQFGGEPIQKRPGERLDVLRTLAQRRQVDRDDVDAKEEIFAKTRSTISFEVVRWTARSGEAAESGRKRYLARRVRWAPVRSIVLCVTRCMASSSTRRT